MKSITIVSIFVLFLLLVFSSCDAHLVGLTVTPSKHNFNSVNIGDSVEFSITVTNISTLAIRISNFNVMGASSFTISEGNTPKQLGGNQIHRVKIKFMPTTAGSQSATLQIFHNGPGKTRTVALSGIGVPVPRIDFSETTYDFGTVGIGQTVTHDFEVENTGTAALILSMLSFNGNPTLFSITAGGATPITINPGGKHIITVQFAPTATSNTPTSFEITHNAVNEIPPSKIDISAAGGGGKMDLNQTSPWDFGLARTNFAKIDVLEISNTGTIDLNIQNIGLTTATIFRIEKIENSTGNPITTPFAISTGDFVEVTIKFTPTSVSNFNDSLSIGHDGSYSASPAVLNLAGTGRNPITVTTTYTGNAVNWNVPAGVASLTAEVWGSQGGGSAPGRGSRMKGDFTVTPGSSLEVCAGGGSGGANSGGEASYVAAGATLMLIAGGGGGSNYSYAAGVSSVITENGTRPYQYNGAYQGGAPGTGGNGGTGGTGGWGTGGGGGWLSAGGNAYGTQGGVIKGKASRGTTFAGGAAGGYSGGGGCDMDSGWSTAGGGGGGSKNNGTNQSNTAGVRTSNGEVQIVY